MSDKFRGGVFAGSTSVSMPFVLRNTSNNLETTGKVASDLTLSYWRQGSTRTAITASDLAAVNSAWSSGGVKEVDATNEPGLYRLDLPDAAVATGADWVAVSVKCSGSYVFHERFALTTDPVQTGDSYARLGAPAGASVSADVAAVKGVLPAALVSGRIDASVGAMAANTITASAIATDAITSTGLAASAVTEIQTGLATSSALATVQADTDDIQTRLPAALVGGRMDSSVGAMASNVVTAAAIATDAIDSDAIATTAVTEIQAGLSTLTAAGVRSAVGLASANLDTQLAGIQSDTDDIQARIPAALVSGRMDASVGAMAAGTVTAAAIATDAIDSDAIAASAVTEIQAGLATAAGVPSSATIADAVWDEAIAGHLTSGSTGAALNAAGAAGDPWSTALPGAYAAGTAGKILGTNLDAPVSGVAAAVWAVSVRTLSSFGTLAADAATAVWGAATRVLTAGTNIVLAKGTGVTGFNDLSAAQVKAQADQALADAGVTTTVTGRIDAAISSRLATASYTAPDNASIAAAAADAATILTRTDVATSSRAAPGAAMTLTAGERSASADALLVRNLGTGSDGGRTVRDALRPLRNKTAIVGGTLTVMAEDDATPAWTALVTTAPSDPLSGVDPT